MASLLHQFICSKNSITDRNEIQEMYGDVTVEDKIPLESLLDDLISRGKLRRKDVIDSEGECHCIYWIPRKKNVSCAVDDKKVSSPLSAAGACKRKTKFVSPLVASKKSKQGLDQTVERTAASSDTELLQEKARLQTELGQKKERLRKLNMAKLYRSKNDLEHMKELIEKWREVSQEAADQLLQLSPSALTMAQLLGYMNISPDVIHYSIEDETFY